MTKIGIIGAGTGALPSEVLRMAEEANVEIVELDKDFSPTDIPQFEDRVYTIQPRPELPHIEWCEPVRFGKGGSKRCVIISSTTCSNTASVQAICGYAKLTEEID